MNDLFLLILFECVDLDCNRLLRDITPTCDEELIFRIFIDQEHIGDNEDSIRKFGEWDGTVEGIQVSFRNHQSSTREGDCDREKLEINHKIIDFVNVVVSSTAIIEEGSESRGDERPFSSSHWLCVNGWNQMDDVLLKAYRGREGGRVPP